MEMGFTDDWYTDGRVLSVIIVPIDFIAFTDGMSLSVKLVNGVVFSDFIKFYLIVFCFLLL